MNGIMISYLGDMSLVNLHKSVTLYGRTLGRRLCLDAALLSSSNFNPASPAPGNSGCCSVVVGGEGFLMRRTALD